MPQRAIYPSKQLDSKAYSFDDYPEIKRKYCVIIEKYIS